MRWVGSGWSQGAETAIGIDGTAEEDEVMEGRGAEEEDGRGAEEMLVMGVERGAEIQAYSSRGTQTSTHL